MKKIIMTEPVLVEEYFNSLQAFKLRNAADYLLMEEEALKEDLIFNQEMIEKGYIALEADGEATPAEGEAKSAKDKAAEKAARKAEKAARKAENQEKKNKKKEKGIGNRIGRFIQSIIDWISNLFGNYEKNTKESIKKKAKWVKENLDKIKNIDDKFWDEYFIDFEPYYGTKANPIQEKFKNSIYSELTLKKVNADGTGDTKRIDEGFEDDKKMLEWASVATLYKFNKDEPSAVEAAKAYYRGRYTVKEGNVRYTGTSFKTVMLSMAEFVKEYGKIAVAISTELKNMERVCDDIAKKAEGPKQIKASESFYDIDKYDSLLYSIIEEDYLWNIPRYKKIVENSHIILEDAVGTPVKTEEGGSGGTPKANPDGDKNNNEEEQREEQKTQEKDQSKAFTNRMKYVKLIISIMTARMTVAEECYNKSFNCLRKVLTMAYDNKFLKEPITDAEKPEKKTEETAETPPKKQEETAEPPKGEETTENPKK